MQTDDRYWKCLGNGGGKVEVFDITYQGVMVMAAQGGRKTEMIPSYYVLLVS